MGVCLTANNSSYSFYMGYFGFHILRRSIAEIIDPEFAQLYHEMLAGVFMEDRIEAEKKLSKLLADEDKFPEDIECVLDFLFQPDVEGKVSYKTCKKLYDLIKDVNFDGKSFRYVCDQNSEMSDYEMFKKFLKECYRYHRNMRWY